MTAKRRPLKAERQAAQRRTRDRRREQQERAERYEARPVLPGERATLEVHAVTALLSPRLWLALIVAAALTFSHFAAYRSGRAVVRAEWETERAKIAKQVAKAESAARAQEQQMADANRKLTDAYQAEKKRRAADARAADDALRVLNAELAAARDATANAAAGIGADDPRGTIAGECSAALVALDKHAQGMAAKARALQDYASEVRVK